MRKLPTTSQEFPVRGAEASEIQQNEPLSFVMPFFTFSYTSQQIQITNGETLINSKHVSFDGSKINAEEFEGRLPANVFEQSLLDTQRQFMDQTTNILKRFSSWFPLPAIDRSDKK